MITVLLFCLLQLIPVPVDFTPSDGVCTHEKITVKQCNGSFKRAMTALEPFQRQEAYRLTINPGRIIIEALSPEGEFRARTTIEQLRLAAPLPTGPGSGTAGLCLTRAGVSRG